MHFISCECCGVVIDLSRIPQPRIYSDEGSVRPSKAAWDGDEYRATILCPLCQRRIFYHNGDSV